MQRKLKLVENVFGKSILRYATILQKMEVEMNIDEVPKTRPKKPNLAEIRESFFAKE